MNEQIIVENKDQVKELYSKVKENAEKSCKNIKKILEERASLEVFHALRFQRVGYEPIEGYELNFVEQINQHFSDLVAIRAMEYLMELYGNSSFCLNLGNKSGFDIESKDENVVAECFAATNIKNNRKIYQDACKLLEKAINKKKYIIFYSEANTENELERVYQKYPEITFKRIKILS